MEVIKVKNLYHTFDGSNYILKDISLSLKKSESIAIMGPSGSGADSIMMTDTINSWKLELPQSIEFSDYISIPFLIGWNFLVYFIYSL